MITYYDDRPYPSPRLHPYAAGNPEQHGYVDFKADNKLIEATLEDFSPFAHRQATQTFYALIRELNGLDSHLETSDCALRPPYSHRDKNSTLPVAIDGRLVLLYRHLPYNCGQPTVRWLCGTLMSILARVDPAFEASAAVVGFTLNPVIQLAQSEGEWVSESDFSCAEDDPGRGQHLMLSFWAYGKDEGQAFENLDRLFRNVQAACRQLNEQIDRSITEAQATQSSTGLG